MSQLWTRRGALAGGLVAAAGCRRQPPPTTQTVRSPVAILRAPGYESDLVETLLAGAELLKWKLTGRRVLVKPNLVEFDEDAAINTHPRLVAAVVEMARVLGASEVRIGEGPGHRRDTLGLAEQAGYFREVGGFERRFVDLNRDDVVARPGFLEGGRIYLPAAAVDADVLISVPKLKTHHWAGLTAAMKNLFGLVPGAVYGWPKNPLHYAGIDRSIVELNRMFRNTFAIVDGVVGMEGNGPIQGTARGLGVVVMSPDVVAADATCARLIGIEPREVAYLWGADGLGCWQESGIEQRGERLSEHRQGFALPPGMERFQAGFSGESAIPLKGLG